MIQMTKMPSSEIGRIGDLDRSEQVTLGYYQRDGKLEAEEVDWDVPRWFSDDRSEHSVQANIRAWTPLLEKHGGTMLGAFEGDLLVGVAIYRPNLTEDMAQLAVLHVSKDHRRRGIATKLAAEVIRLARADGVTQLYVSATPSGSAVGFYQSQGFGLVEKPHPALYALEPEDIHMIKALEEDDLP
jgi:ribosomal protein S18 acetylase RimI-like enzyme